MQAWDLYYESLAYTDGPSSYRASLIYRTRRRAGKGEYDTSVEQKARLLQFSGSPSFVLASFRPSHLSCWLLELRLRLMVVCDP